MVSQNSASGKGKKLNLKPEQAVRPHVKVSLEDINWLREQPPATQQLWFDCVAAEQFGGGQKRQIETELERHAFHRAKKSLEVQRLFSFEAIAKVLPSGQLAIGGWKVQNLHGYYAKWYWELVATNCEQDVATSSASFIPTFGTKDAELGNKRRQPLEQKTPSLGTKDANLQPETLTMTAFENPQQRVNKGSTTPQPPTKVVGGGFESGSFSENQSQLGAEPPNPQAQSFEAGLLGGELCSPPNGDPPLVASQGEEVSIQFLEGQTDFPVSEDSIASLEVQEEAAAKEVTNQDLDQISAAPPTDCEKINSALEPDAIADDQEPVGSGFKVGDSVALADPYVVAYAFHGIVQDISEQDGVLVRWLERAGQSNECERYQPGDLRTIAPIAADAGDAPTAAAAPATPTEPTAAALTDAPLKIGDRVFWDKCSRTHPNFGKPFEIVGFKFQMALLDGVGVRPIPLSELRLSYG